MCEKYRFFLRAWLRTPVFGTDSSESKTLVKKRPKKGVPQGSIIGPTCCNVVLDGLENACLAGLPQNYTLTSDEQALKKKVLNVEVLTERQKRPGVTMRIIRYADDILIVGRGPVTCFETVHARLINFLASRGLNIKNSDNNILNFDKGASFDFLGFRFIQKNDKDSIIDRGKFSK